MIGLCYNGALEPSVEPLQSKRGPIPYQRSKHRRRSIRLKGYDYTAPGAYFVTINVHNKRYLFGRVIDGKMHLNKYGKVASDCWQAIPDHFPNVDLDAFVVMPTHMHGIIVIVDEVDVQVADRTSADTGAATPTGDENIIEIP